MERTSSFSSLVVSFEMVKTVACPTCGKPVPWTPESRWRPFCSERCRLIDLGAWLTEQHRISTPGNEVLDQEPSPIHTEPRPKVS